MKPLRRVKIKWSRKFAYAIGLIATDGNLSKDGRHVVFTSKDEESIKDFLKALSLDSKSVSIKRKGSGSNKEKDYYFVQIGDVVFYRFLNSIGLTTNKSKSIGAIKVPSKYFIDFLRGHFDGDGSFFSYWDKRWKSSFMFYLSFVSASLEHIDWLRQEIHNLFNVKGHITKSSVFQLKYAKSEATQIIKGLYTAKCLRLSRKYNKIKLALSVA
jgi:intein-encoded DNA endonuclease-like protein